MTRLTLRDDVPIPAPVYWAGRTAATILDHHRDVAFFVWCAALGFISSFLGPPVGGIYIAATIVAVAVAVLALAIAERRPRPAGARGECAHTNTVPLDTYDKQVIARICEVCEEVTTDVDAEWLATGTANGTPAPFGSLAEAIRYGAQRVAELDAKTAAVTSGEHVIPADTPNGTLVTRTTPHIRTHLPTTPFHCPGCNTPTATTVATNDDGELCVSCYSHIAPDESGRVRTLVVRGLDRFARGGYVAPTDDDNVTVTLNYPLKSDYAHKLGLGHRSHPEGSNITVPRKVARKLIDAGYTR